MPVLLLPGKIGIHVSPQKHKTALLEANIVDFEQQQQNTRRGVSITALLCVLGSLGASPVPGSWG